MGGLFGLGLGMSFISVIEFIYFVLIRLYCPVRFKSDPIPSRRVTTSASCPALTGRTADNNNKFFLPSSTSSLRGLDNPSMIREHGF